MEDTRPRVTVSATLHPSAHERQGGEGDGQAGMTIPWHGVPDATSSERDIPGTVDDTREPGPDLAPIVSHGHTAVVTPAVVDPAIDQAANNIIGAAADVIDEPPADADGPDEEESDPGNTDSDSDDSGPPTLLGALRPLSPGLSRIQFGHETWLRERVADDPSRFFLLIEGLYFDGVHTSYKLFLPNTLEEARDMSFSEWNTHVENVRDQFQIIMSMSQENAVKTIAYVYIWFSRELAAGDVRDVAALWHELTQMIDMMASMGLYLGTRGDRLIFNLRQWAQHRIEDALPTYLRDATKQRSPGDIPAEPVELLEWDDDDP